MVTCVIILASIFCVIIRAVFHFINLRLVHLSLTLYLLGNTWPFAFMAYQSAFFEICYVGL